MEYGSIERELHIEASPEVVFEVLTDPRYIVDWWEAATDYEPVAGATSRFTWHHTEDDSIHSTPFTVVEVDAPRLFSFRWTYDEGVEAGEGNSLLVTFELTPDGAGTHLTFRETGYREHGWEAAVLEAQYLDHAKGWDFYLSRLAAASAKVAVAK